MLFCEEINYIVEKKEDFKITTSQVDEEISAIAGPQLVVPIDNARYALNAANARWGSLYDAVYGSDVLGDTPSSSVYSPERGARVVAFSKAHLDKFAP